MNSEDDKTFVITDEGRVGIGKTNHCACTPPTHSSVEDVKSHKLFFI